MRTDERAFATTKAIRERVIRKTQKRKFLLYASLFKRLGVDCSNIVLALFVLVSMDATSPLSISKGLFELVSIGISVLDKSTVGFDVESALVANDVVGALVGLILKAELLLVVLCFARANESSRIAAKRIES